MRILLVEDEIYLAESIEYILKKEHYTVDLAFDGEEALDLARDSIYDLLILDIMLPKKDGLTVLKELRAEEIKTPVLLLTARSGVDDRVKGLDQGADDYLAKPFDSKELLARIRALLRRPQELLRDNTLLYNDIQLNASNLLLNCGSNEIALTKKEADLLEYLMLNKNQVISKEQMIEKIWGYASEAEANHVEVYISFLRKKLNHIESKARIQTVRGVGYRLQGEDSV